MDNQELQALLDRESGVETALVKLDLGGGDNVKEGFDCVDAYAENAKYKVDLLDFSKPWPFEDNTVDEIHCSHFFEHTPGLVRGKFMDEVWRIMKVGAKATFITPYWSSMRSVQDFNHMWPPICENSYIYFNKGWRQVNKLEHYLNCKCDFDIVQTAAILDGETAAKSAEVGAFWNKHYTNSVSDLIVTLQKRPV